MKISRLKQIIKEEVYSILSEGNGDGHHEIDPGPKRWFKPYGDKYTEYEKATNKELKEATLPKFKTPYEAYSWIMNKRGEAMDIETEMMETSKEIQMAYGEMEQDAEPGGGPIADRYGKEIEALENKHKDLRAEFNMVMAEIDEYDQNY